MSATLGLGLALLGLAAVGGLLLLRSARARERAEERVATLEQDEDLEDGRDESRSLLTPPAYWGWIAAVVAGAGAWLWGLAPLYASAAAAVAGVLAHIISRLRADARALDVEETLAESIGLVASGLRAGSSPTEALERAASEAGGLLGKELERMVARLRLGEEPRSAIATLGEALPLDSVRLFALALSVQWAAGGSLERSLTIVARSVRDRAEVLRRIESQMAPTRASVGVLLIANGIVAALAWSNDPANVGRFLASETGAMLVSGSIWLQALALLWMWRLSKVA